MESYGVSGVREMISHDQQDGEEMPTTRKGLFPCRHKLHIICLAAIFLSIEFAMRAA
jgi:hypothetical protein